MNTIGNNIKTLRQKNSWNQSQVAIQLKISIPAYSKIETGVTDPSISRLIQIAEVFGVHVITLITGRDPRMEQGEEFLKLQNKLRERETEVIKLQTRLIELYEEVREKVI